MTCSFCGASGADMAADALRLCGGCLGVLLETSAAEGRYDWFRAAARRALFREKGRETRASSGPGNIVFLGDHLPPASFPPVSLPPSFP